MALRVNEQSQQVLAMSRNWPMVDALLGGTKGMRDAGEKFLPKQPNEEKEDWEYRRDVATLFPAWERTLSVMAGKPFSRELVLTEDVPSKLVEWLEDCDLEGRNLHTFSSEMMTESMAYGLAGVLVEYPRVGGLRTQAEEDSLGIRPYLVQVNHDQILGWRSERTNGAAMLTQLRIAEAAEVNTGDYCSSTVNRVRVLTPGAWELWQEPEKDGKDYILIDRGETTLSVIPFVPFYGRRKGFMSGISPLMNLAYMNVEHWQESSDQKDSARFARKRLLVLTGVDGQDVITAGSNYAMRLPQGGEAKIVQGSAESVTVGRSEIDALEDRMIQAGAELLVPQAGQRTATEASNDAEANKSELLRIVEQFEDSLDQCLQLMAEWVKLPTSGKVSLFKDFGASGLTDASAQLIVSMQQGGLITKQTAIREQQRRGILSPDIEPDNELAAVGEEGPALGVIGNGGE